MRRVKNSNCFWVYLALLEKLYQWLQPTLFFLDYQIVSKDKIAFGFIHLFLEKIYQGLLVTLL